MRGTRAVVALTSACALLAAPAAEARRCPGAHMRLTDGNAAKVRRATVCLVNRRRVEAGLRKVRLNRRLVKAATAHSQDMVAARYFAHDGPAGDTMLTRAFRCGYLTGKEHAYGLAENLAVGRGRGGTAARIVRKWMRSPVHRANVLLERSRDAGIGLVRGRPSGGRGVTATLDLGYAR